MNKYKIYWYVFVIEAILYGSICTYLGENCFFTDVWSLLRYIVLFAFAIGMEKECNKVKMSKRSKRILYISTVFSIVIWVLGYYLSTLAFLSPYYFLILFIMFVFAIMGKVLFSYIFQNSMIDNETMVLQKILDMHTTEDIYNITITNIEAKNMVTSMNYLAAAIVSLGITYFIIPIFIKNTNISLISLYILGFLFFGLFCFLYYQRYRIIQNNFKKNYLIEVCLAFIGTTLMYYVDGFVHRGFITTNFVLNIMYVILILPILYSWKEQLKKFSRILAKIGKK